MSKKKKKATLRVLPGHSRGLPVGTKVRCADNSGAKIAQIIAVKGVKTRLRRRASATVGDLVIVSVKSGTQKMRRQIVPAVVIRQRKPYRRSDGSWIAFEDNAVVITNEVGEPKGSEIRGAVAREATEKYYKIGSLSSFTV